MQLLLRSLHKSGPCRTRTVALALLLAVAGCREPDEIRHYRVTLPETAEATVRILGGILPDGDRSWFFKFMGPPDALAKHEGEFDRFLSSVRLQKDGEKPVTWTLPENWREGKSRPQRYATLLIGNGDKPLELTVTNLGGALFDNVKRWHEQVSPKPFTSELMSRVTREVRAGDSTITRVDVSGPGGKSPKMPPFAGMR